MSDSPSRLFFPRARNGLLPNEDIESRLAMVELLGMFGGMPVTLFFGSRDGLFFLRRAELLTLYWFFMVPATLKWDELMLALANWLRLQFSFFLVKLTNDSF